jgi:hypothetical protein
VDAAKLPVLVDHRESRLAVAVSGEMLRGRNPLGPGMVRGRCTRILRPRGGRRERPRASKARDDDRDR